MANENKQAYYLKNKECLKQKAKERYKNKRKEVLLQKHNYYVENKEDIIERFRNVSSEKKEQRKEYKRQHREENKNSPNVRFVVAKSAAKSRNIIWSLSKQEYTEIISKSCYYCNNNFGDNNINCGVGLDRINNSMGYAVDNVVSCCAKCNFVRGTILTPEETKVAIQAIIEFRKRELQ